MAEDTEVDTAEQSAIKLRAQQLSQTSNALVITDQCPANGTPPVSQPGLVKLPSPSTSNDVDNNSEDQRLSQVNRASFQLDSQPQPADVIGDLLGTLAIEGPPSSNVHPQPNANLGMEGTAMESSAIVLAGEQANAVQPIGNIAEKFRSLCLKDCGVLYEDPYIQIGVKAEWRAHHGRLVLYLGNKKTYPLVSVQAIILPPTHLKMDLSLVPETIPPRAQVQCPLEVINLHPSRDVAVLDFSYKFGNEMEQSFKWMHAEIGSSPVWVNDIATQPSP